MKNTNAIRMMKRMNDVINEMRKLQDEFEELMNLNNPELTDKEMTETIDEDLDEYENLSEEVEELIEDEYDEFEDEYDEFEDDDEEELYNVYLSEEQFEAFFEVTSDIPYGYVHDRIDNKYLIILDEDTIYDVEERLEKEYYYRKYEYCSSNAAREIVDIQNEIYLQTR